MVVQDEAAKFLINNPAGKKINFFMKITTFSLRLFWWLCAAYVPIKVSNFYQSYRAAIKCPLSGDCYNPGWELFLSFELLIVFAAIAIWPLFAWYVIVKPWRTRTDRLNEVKR